jgi:hypothetical protein
MPIPEDTIKYYHNANELRGAQKKHTHTHTHAVYHQAAEYYRKAAEEAAQKAKEGIEGGIDGAQKSAGDLASQGGEMVKVDGANVESPGWLTNMWEAAQKAAQDAQKAAMEVCAYACLRLCDIRMFVCQCMHAQ